MIVPVGAGAVALPLSVTESVVGVLRTAPSALPISVAVAREISSDRDGLIAATKVVSLWIAVANATRAVWMPAVAASASNAGIFRTLNVKPTRHDGAVPVGLLNSTGDPGVNCSLSCAGSIVATLNATPAQAVPAAPIASALTATTPGSRNVSGQSAATAVCPQLGTSVRLWSDSVLPSLFWGAVELFVTVTLPATPCLPTASPEDRSAETLIDAADHADDAVRRPTAHVAAVRYPHRLVALIPVLDLRVVDGEHTRCDRRPTPVVSALCAEGGYAACCCSRSA